MITFAVTVTYGNRFHLLKQVIDGALREGVSKVIVVDNNSVPQSREHSNALIKNCKIYNYVIYQIHNYPNIAPYIKYVIAVLFRLCLFKSQGIKNAK